MPHPPDRSADVPTINYDAVRRWTKDRPPLVNADLIVVPVNEGDRHWMLILVSLSRKEIVMLDRCVRAAAGYPPPCPPV